MKITKKELQSMIEEQVKLVTEANETPDQKEVDKLVRDIKASRVKINDGFKSNDMKKVEEGVVDLNSLIADAKSGVSGAGRKGSGLLSR